ncbi:hypothetical protein [Erysipelothrix larvae]|nr:hypothetical protein [Erysipelothrix larvae]
MLKEHESWINMLDAPLPNSQTEIFLHNLPVMILFGLPFLGFPFALFSLGTNALMIAISIKATGLMHTAHLLIHLPLELFALVGLARCKQKTIVKRLVLCTALLWLSAFIEIRLV